VEEALQENVISWREGRAQAQDGDIGRARLSDQLTITRGDIRLNILDIQFRPTAQGQQPAVLQQDDGLALRQFAGGAEGGDGDSGAPARAEDADSLRFVCGHRGSVGGDGEVFAGLGVDFES